MQAIQVMLQQMAKKLDGATISDSNTNNATTGDGNTNNATTGDGNADNAKIGDGNVTVTGYA